MAQVAFAITALTESSEKLSDRLISNEKHAAQMLDGSEKLLLAIESASRELDEGLPAAFARMEQRFAASRGAFESLLQDAKLVESRTSQLSSQLAALQTALNDQTSGLEELISGDDEKLIAHKDRIEMLSSSVATAKAMIDDLANAANGDVSNALHNIRVTTSEVAAASKEMLKGELATIAETLTEQNRSILNKAVEQQVLQLNDAMQTAIERNLALSQTASEKITQQLAQLNDMANNLEARVGDTRAKFAGIDDAGFARRMALLTESLNSSAIDVAKILSNEVTDTAWASYLKGDRGVFTRRAVKLLDGNESKIVASYYEDDAEFREHVSRYIHDFEAMMRELLSTRDGNALGITLLSSDVGKLYVALAQAIDRLRN
jgi:predicted transcriptional regulator